MTLSPTRSRHVRVRRHSVLRQPRTSAIEIPAGRPAHDYDLAAERLGQSPASCLGCATPVEGGLVERRTSQDQIMLEVWPACGACIGEVEERVAGEAVPSFPLQVECPQHPGKAGAVPCGRCRALAFCDEACAVLTFFLRGGRGCRACVGEL